MLKELSHRYYVYASGLIQVITYNGSCMWNLHDGAYRMSTPCTLPI